MADKIVSVPLTRVQLARLRMTVYRELHHEAEGLVDAVHRALEHGGDVAGEDAHTAYNVVRESAELLGALGWSVKGDHELIHEEICRWAKEVR